MPKQQKLQREAHLESSHVAEDPGIDAFCIGVERRARSRRQSLYRAAGEFMQTKRADELVVIQRGNAENFRKPPLASTAQKLHLPQTILRMQETEGKIGVVAAFCENMRHRVLSHHHLDGSVDARHGHHTRQRCNRLVKEENATRKHRDHEHEP